MFEFVAWLFDTSRFVPRKNCGDWTSTLMWMHIGGDLFIWLAYISIPLVLLYFTRRRDLPYPRLFVLFALFILACGFGHLIEALMFQHPLYRLAGVWKVLTAVVSWATVLALIPVIPTVMAAMYTSVNRPLPVARFGDTALHRLAVVGSRDQWREYIIAVLVAVLALLIRAVLDDITGNDHVYVLSLLGVVFVSWRSGFGPAIATLLISMIGMVYFFIPERRTFVVVGFGNQLATAMFFFCGVCCAALGEAQYRARQATKAALAVALEQKDDLAVEVARRREVEHNLLAREADLTRLNDKLAAAQVRIAEVLAQVEALVLNAPVGIALFDPKFHYVRVNKVFADASRRPIPEHLGRSIAEVTPLFSRELISHFEQVLDTEVPILDERVVPGPETPSPGSVWRVSVFPVLGADGRKLGLGVIGQDVSDRERAENELRESEGRFRSMADGAAALIWLSGTDTARTYFNRTWLEFTGRTIEQDLGAGWVENLHPEDQERYLELYEQAFAERREFELEYRLRRRDGEYRWVLARGSPRFTPSGAFSGFVGLCLDVTDRRQAEEAVRANEQRYRTLTEAIPQIVWNAGPDGEVSYFNRRWQDYTGLSVEAAHGRGWMQALHPDDRDHAYAAWQETIRNPAGTGDRFSQELRLRHAETGEYRWFLAVAVPLRGADGAIDQWIGAMADIQGQKTAAEKIAESEAKFRTMAESIPQLAWMTDADGYIFWYNQRWYDYTGTTLEEMKGWGWQAVQDPVELPRVLEKFKAHIASGAAWEDTFPLRRHDGEFRWHLSRALPIRDSAGKIVRWFGTNTDITAQRELEHALAAAADRFRTLAEAIPNVVWTATPTGDVDYFNPRWHEYTGLTAEQSRQSGWINAIHQVDRAEVATKWRASMAGGSGAHESEYRLRRADGEYRWFLVRGLRVAAENERHSRWVGTMTDIHDRKVQAQTLEQMVKERTADLEAVNVVLATEIEERRQAESQVRAVATELARSNNELEQFAYIASHDLQEPLRKIQAFGDRLTNKYRNELPEAGQEYVDRMQVSAGRMRRLIDDLLSFSRVTTQAKPFAEVDLAKLVGEVVSDLSERIEPVAGKVLVRSLPRIVGDPSQFRQLFQNLIVNAVKFQQPGVPPVVEVSAELVNEPLPDPDSEPVPAYRITVRDNGIGFDEKYLGRIFQVFQRLHGKEEYEGTGVGLAICRKIAQRHGGTITAQSRIGEGAAFVVTLPVHQPDPPAEPPGD